MFCLSFIFAFSIFVVFFFFNPILILLHFFSDEDGSVEIIPIGGRNKFCEWVLENVVENAAHPNLSSEFFFFFFIFFFFFTLSNDYHFCAQRTQITNMARSSPGIGDSWVNETPGSTQNAAPAKKEEAKEEAPVAEEAKEEAPAAEEPPVPRRDDIVKLWNRTKKLLLHSRIRSILLFYFDFLVLIFILILVCFCVIDFFF